MYAAEIYQQQAERLRFWNRILILLLAAAVVFVLVMQQADRPTCPVALKGDGTWQRSDQEGAMLNGCRLVILDQ